MFLSDENGLHEATGFVQVSNLDIQVQCPAQPHHKPTAVLSRVPGTSLGAAENVGHHTYTGQHQNCHTEDEIQTATN